MISKVYSIFDSASRTYGPPFHCITDSAAKRAFGDAANSRDHFVGKHPADYTLMLVATFCDQTGAYLPLAQFENLGNAQIFLRATSETQTEMDIPNG
ncbi:MAG: nonstructural protein [Microvirus sp.]|nr:MAG: nonstructural protein [Microvirus sp.]